MYKPLLIADLYMDDDDVARLDHTLEVVVSGVHDQFPFVFTSPCHMYPLLDVPVIIVPSEEIFNNVIL